MKVKDRIKEFKRIKPSSLYPHPKNWRTHDDQQKDAIRGVFAEVGIAGVLVVREFEDGYQLIDGHLRAETLPDQDVPCVVLDVSEEEADILLATYDPISAMAKTDNEQLAGLISNIDATNDVLADMLEKMQGVAEEELLMDVPPVEKDEKLQADGDEDMVVLSIVLSPSQNTTLRSAIQKSKETHGFETSGEAIIAIVDEWQKQNPTT